MPPKRAQRSRSRQTTPQSPPKQSTLYVSPRQLRGATTERSYPTTQVSVQKKQLEKSLPDVDEEIDSEDGIEVVKPSPPSDIGPSESATNAQTTSDDDIDDTSSNGTTQLELLDSDLIIDSLPVLYQASTQILSLIASKPTLDIARDVSDPLSKTSKRLRNFTAHVNTSRRVYGTASYINIPLILRKLAEGVEINEGPWRPDAILQRANLSLLTADLSQHDETFVYDTLERMFNTFPDPFGHFTFTSGQRRYKTKLINETVSFGIALRTQFYLEVVEKSKSDAAFDPDSLLRKVFFDEDDRINGFQGEGEYVLPEIEKAILKQVGRIRKFFKKSGRNPIDLNGLKRQFPWQSFLADAFRWISLRKQELDADIVAQGGINAIQDRLEQQDFTLYNDYTPAVQAIPEVAEVHDENEGLLQKETHRISDPPATSRLYSMSKLEKNIARLKTIEAEAKEDEESTTNGGSDSDDSIHSSVREASPLRSPAARPRSKVPEVPQSPDAAVDNNNVIDGDDDEDVEQQDVEAEENERVVRQPSPPRPTQSSIVPTQQTKAVLEVARQQAALSNKENVDENGNINSNKGIDTTRRSYIDKQPNAKRIAWDESQTGQKRTRQLTDEDNDDDDDETDDFENDSRPQKRPRYPQPPAPGAVDDWIEDTADDEIEQQASQQLRNDSHHAPPSTEPLPHRSPLQDRTRNTISQLPSSSAPQPRSNLDTLQHRPHRHHSEISTHSSTHSGLPSSTARAHQAVNAEAKATMRARHILDPSSIPPRLTQSRRAWSTPEVNRLFEMIAEYGCAWALILAEDLNHPDGPELQNRGQVQLKDKARNLKMDYLKAGTELPEGFGRVTIKSSDKELLRELGMPYE